MDTGILSTINNSHVSDAVEWNCIFLAAVLCVDREYLGKQLDAPSSQESKDSSGGAVSAKA